jgi:hypothetical protein
MGQQATVGQSSGHTTECGLPTSQSSQLLFCSLANSTIKIPLLAAQSDQYDQTNLRIQIESETTAQKSNLYR